MDVYYGNYLISLTVLVLITALPFHFRHVPPGLRYRLAVITLLSCTAHSPILPRGAHNMRFALVVWRTYGPVSCTVRTMRPRIGFGFRFQVQ